MNITRIIITGFAAAFWALILHRKNGPFNLFARLRRLSEKVPGLRSVLGEVSGCETCCCFWLTLFFSAGCLGHTPVPDFYCLLGASAAAGFALWLMPTMVAQVGMRQENDLSA